MADHSIIIEQDAGAIRVTVKPPVDGFDYDQPHDDYRSARGYAGGLRMSCGWPIVDRVGDMSATQKGVCNG